MEALSCCAEQAESLSVSRIASDAARRCRRRCRYRLERHQHRHRTAAVAGPDAAVSRDGVSAGARLRIGRPDRRRGARLARRIGETVFVPGATLFRRNPRPVRRCGVAACGAIRRERCRSIRTLGERGVLIALAATAQHAIAGGAAARSDRWAWRGRPSAGAPRARGRRPAARGLGDQSTASTGAEATRSCIPTATPGAVTSVSATPVATRACSTR